MKVGIMQPYFFPYIGYWQLINCVDKYVIYDDVNFIKSGWINRNRILINDNPRYINLPLVGSSPNKLINEISISDNKNLLKKVLRSIEFSYKKAPYLRDSYELFESIILYDERNLAKWLENSIKNICKYLDINTEIIISSNINKNNQLKSVEKVLNICEVLGANEYINAIEELYKDKKLLNILSRNTKEYAKKEFSIEKMSLEWQKVFNEIINIEKSKKNWNINDKNNLKAIDIFFESIGEYKNLFNLDNELLKEELNKPNWLSYSKGTPKQYDSFLHDGSLDRFIF